MDHKEQREQSLQFIPGFDKMDERVKIICRVAYNLGAMDANERFIEFIESMMVEPHESEDKE